MQIVRTVFAGRPISHFADIICPTRSPGLVEPDYFLRGYVKSKVYETRPANIDDLKTDNLGVCSRDPRRNVTTCSIKSFGFLPGVVFWLKNQKNQKTLHNITTAAEAFNHTCYNLL
jgi:hypothetical protein